MIFDIEENDDGVWFDMEGGGRVKLRTISPKDFLEIRKASMKRGEPIVRKVDGVSKLFEREIVDEDLQLEMMRDKSIVDWENLFDKNNKPISVTSENKALLMLMKDGSFRDFVTAKLRELQEAENGKVQDIEKNS